MPVTYVPSLRAQRNFSMRWFVYYPTLQFTKLIKACTNVEDNGIWREVLLEISMLRDKITNIRDVVTLNLYQIEFI